jgi:purine-nucleoside phosphorylase
MGRGADAVFVTVGAIPAFDTAPQYLARGGRVIMVGMPHSGAMSSYEPVMIAALGQGMIGSKMGDTVIAMSATGDDPLTLLLTDGEAHAPTGDWKLVELAARLGRESGAMVHVGPIVTSAIFYDRREGIMARWRDRGHLAVEMEASILYTLAAIHGFEALAIMTVSDLIASETETERISDDELQRGVDQMMQVACDVATADL